MAIKKLITKWLGLNRYVDLGKLNLLKRRGITPLFF